MGLAGQNFTAGPGLFHCQSIAWTEATLCVKLVCDSKTCWSGEARLIHLRRIIQSPSPSKEDNERLRTAEKTGKGRKEEKTVSSAQPSTVQAGMGGLASGPALLSLLQAPVSAGLLTLELPVAPCSHIEAAPLSPRRRRPLSWPQRPTLSCQDRSQQPL